MKFGKTEAAAFFPATARSLIVMKDNTNNNKSFDRNVAYYQDELNFLWSVYGHEPNLKEVLNWHSWERGEESLNKK